MVKHPGSPALARRAARGILVFAIASSSVAHSAWAQRDSRRPGPETRRVVVLPLRGDSADARRIANALRARIRTVFPSYELLVITTHDVDETVQLYHLGVYAAPTIANVRELARYIRADEVITGRVTRSGGSFRVEAQLVVPFGESPSQPFAIAGGRDPRRVAAALADEYASAREQLVPTQQCQNYVRLDQLDEAKRVARSSIAKNRRSTLAQLCLADAFLQERGSAGASGTWTDSVIAIASVVLARDAQSSAAHRLLAEAYRARGDTSKWILHLDAYGRDNPDKVRIIDDAPTAVDARLAERSVPRVAQLLRDNPGDAQYARLYWMVLRAAKRYRDAVPAGEAYVAIDTAAADTQYYVRQITDLVADGDTTRAKVFVARGLAKFPADTTLSRMHGALVKPRT